MNGEPSQVDRLLMTELFKLGQEISSYVLRVMGVDAEQGEPVTAEDEFRMGSRLVELGTVLQVRAAERTDMH